MSKLLVNKFIKSKPVQLSARTLDRFLSTGLRALDQGLSTVMDDLVNGKRSRRGSRMARSVLKAAGAPKGRAVYVPHVLRASWCTCMPVVVSTYKEDKGMCEIIMERSMNEWWECDQDTGEMVLCGLISDGGASEFSDYYCEAHREYFGTWAEAKAHKEAA